jgi:hypothetical protein
MRDAGRTGVPRRERGGTLAHQQAIMMRDCYKMGRILGNYVKLERNTAISVDCLKFTAATKFYIVKIHLNHRPPWHSYHIDILPTAAPREAWRTLPRNDGWFAAGAVPVLGKRSRLD